MDYRRFLRTSLALVGMSALLLTPSVEAKRKLRFWVQVNPTWKMMETKFEKENPGVDIELVGGSLDKFYTMITAGMMPDVWGPWDTPGITADVNRNWAMELTSFIKRDGAAMNIDDFFPGLLRQFRVKGKQYSLPIFYSVDYFFYDPVKYAQAGLAKPPIDGSDKDWDWDRMVANAKKMTKYDAQGKVTQAGLDFSHWLDNWFRIWGASLYDQEALKTSIPDKVYFNTPEMVTALTKSWELVYKHKVAPIESKGFTSGSVASSMEPGWIASNIIKVKNLKWNIAPLPWGKTNNGTSWPDGWRISRRTKDKELAWKFVKFLCAPENQRIILTDPKSVMRGLGSSRKSVFSDTMAREMGNSSGMNPADIMRVYEYADDHSVVKEQETVCLHQDLILNYTNPVLFSIFQNKLSPVQGAARLQETADKVLPTLYQRWVRNMKMTGAK